MTNDEARGWIEDRFGIATTEKLAVFVDRVIAENARQNLVSASTLELIWLRHVVDSAQLLLFAPERGGCWIDVGSGAGFPGMVTALISGRHTVLVEPRRRRAEFLADVAEAFGDRRVEVVQSRVETMPSRRASVITARAVSAIDTLFTATAHLTDHDTRYILPRGRGVAIEVENLHLHWHGVFHVEHSLTDDQSGIVIAERVRRR